jgi:hypothetical protein
MTRTTTCAEPMSAEPRSVQPCCAASNTGHSDWAKRLNMSSNGPFHTPHPIPVQDADCPACSEFGKPDALFLFTGRSLDWAYGQYAPLRRREASWASMGPGDDAPRTTAG